MHVMCLLPAWLNATDDPHRLCGLMSYSSTLLQFQFAPANTTHRCGVVEQTQMHVSCLVRSLVCSLAGEIHQIPLEAK